VNIVFTSHAQNKFKILEDRGFKVTKKQVLATLQQPQDLDIKSDSSKIIVSKQVDKKHILRVVYEREGDIITVITFYPAEKGKYYEV